MEKYYSYSPDTGEFIGEGYPDPSPLEEDVFLYPAHCTTKKPPFPRNDHAIVFDGSNWKYVEDHRGEVWYEGFQQVVISSLGPINTDVLTPQPVFPPQPGDEEPEEEMTLTEFSADLRWQLETAGTVWNDWPVHTDAASQAKLLMEVTAVSIGMREDGGMWKFKDGVFRPLTNAELMDLALAARDYVVSLFNREAQIMEQIGSGEITTREEIEQSYATIGVPEELPEEVIGETEE